MRSVVYNTFAKTVFLVLLFACLGLSMLTQLLLPTESFCHTLLNHFIGEVVFFST